MLQGKLIVDDNGVPLCHRTWFKIILNPFLRKMGYVIVSKLDASYNVTGYELVSYPFITDSIDRHGTCHHILNVLKKKSH